MRNGQGKEYYYNGQLKYEGEYLNNEYNAKVEIFHGNGKLLFQGEYSNGKKMEKEKNFIKMVI